MDSDDRAGSVGAAAGIQTEILQDGGDGRPLSLASWSRSMIKPMRASGRPSSMRPSRQHLPPGDVLISDKAREAEPARVSVEASRSDGDPSRALSPDANARLAVGVREQDGVGRRDRDQSYHRRRRRIIQG